MFYTQQQNTFVLVRNEYEARNYPVAYGNSVTFKDENAPYIYTKTMGFSQMESPVFEKFRLVKEEAELPRTDTETNKTITLSAEDLEAKFEAIWAAIAELKPKKEKKDESTK